MLAFMKWAKPHYVFIWFYSIITPLLTWITGLGYPTGLDSAAALGISPALVIASMIAGNFAMVAALTAEGKAQRALFFCGVLPAMGYSWLLLGGYATHTIDGRTLLAAHYVATLVFAGVTMFASYINVRELSQRADMLAGKVRQLEVIASGRQITERYRGGAGQ